MEAPAKTSKVKKQQQHLCRHHGHFGDQVWVTMRVMYAIDMQVCLLAQLIVTSNWLNPCNIHIHSLSAEGAEACMTQN